MGQRSAIEKCAQGRPKRKRFKSRPTNGSHLYRSSSNYLREEQLKDPALKQIISWKEANVRPVWEEIPKEDKAIRAYWLHWDQLELNNGVLYKRWVYVSDKRNEGEELKYIVPSQLLARVFLEVHTQRSGRHFGKKKTLRRVTGRYWWLGWRSSITECYRSCDPCKTRRPPKKTVSSHTAENSHPSCRPIPQEYDVKPLLFECGDKVWLRNTQTKGDNSENVTSQIPCSWEGPFIVKQKLCDVVYRIESHICPPKVVYANRLRKFVDPD